jgi:hypothetical protein
MHSYSLWSEILASRRAFPESLTLWWIAWKVAIDDARPEIPESLPVSTRELIAARVIPISVTIVSEISNSGPFTIPNH